MQPIVHHSTFLGLHVTPDMTAGDLVVGVGTVLLALLTYFAVRVARASVVAQDAPLLIGAHVHGATEVANSLGPANFKPPFAGLLPEGFGFAGSDGPAFVMRLWNVGRGPAVVRDVRLRMGKKDVLKPMPRHVIVDTDSPGIFDATWTSLDVPADQRDATHTGTLHIIYAHPNGSLFETVSEVELHKRSLYFSTIKRRRVRWRRSSSRPRKPEEPKSEEAQAADDSSSIPGP